ncbi:MAG TPA: outer membrane beta-barrel protein [Chitinophagaceae bacterium]|nr:outer membrane beta-barrel protein [Chitinophagaceae bacterium]
MKFILSLALSLLFAGTAIAQNPKNYYVEEPKTFVGGLIGGLNFTQVDGDSYKGYHNIGFNTGVVVYTQLVPGISASLEILFSQKGARSNGSQLSNGGVTVITKQNIKLNYAEIPVQINFFDKKRNHFGAGLSYAQLINSKEEIVGNNSSIKYDPDQYPFKKMDINMILSGQVHVYKGFFAGIRFQYSMLSIRDKVDLEYGRAQQFNNVFALRLMYLFY